MKMLSCRSFIPILLIIFHNQLTICNTYDIKLYFDDFMKAFDESFPETTEEIAQVTTGDIVGNQNEVFTDTAVLAEEIKEVEGPDTDEEPAVEKTLIFQPGSDVKHELTDEFKKMAETALASISSNLKLVNLTEATSAVTDKVTRSLTLVVARKDCEDSSCLVNCQVDLVSHDSKDTVTWHNCLDSPSSNEVYRDKRGAVGGFKEVDEAEAMELAEIAAQTLDSIDADDTKRVVTKVIRAQKQLVNGIMYHLKLEMAMSDCKEDQEKCEGKLSDLNICKILMQRHFTGEAPHNAQVIKSECTPISKLENLKGGKTQKRERRHVTVDGSESNMIINSEPVKKTHSPGRILGGKTKQDTDSAKIKEISEFALAEIDKSTNSLNKQKILRVVDAHTQVVAGVKYYLTLELVETNCRKDSNERVCNPVDDVVLQKCEVEVWDKPWENNRSVTKTECVPVQSRRKRSVLVGGRKPADVNDARVQEIAQFALSQIDGQSNNINSMKLIEVKEAQTQVVAGTNYFLKLVLKDTNCRKGSGINPECDNLNVASKECDVVVYDRPWDKHREMTSANCSDTAVNRRKRETLVGGNFQQDKDSDNVKEIAQFAVEDMNRKSNAMYKQTLVEVMSAETQVVSGINYLLKIRVAESDCKKNSKNEAANCSPKETAVHQECDITVWDQPWTKKREITHSACVEVKKEKAIGGPKAIDPSSSEVLEAAKAGLKMIDQSSNSMYKHAIIRVLDSKVQTVAGKKYFLKLEIGESECIKTHEEENCALRAENTLNEVCNVIVWDQPWLNKKTVTEVKCGRRNKRSIVSAPIDLIDIHASMFEEFKSKYNKVYKNEEEHKKRFRIFRANLKKIETFQENEQGTAVYGPNMFADLSAKEFKQKYLGLNPGPFPKPSKHHMVPAQIPDVALPTDFDWRDHNAVTPVKNQGQCGSCWAFSVTGNVEGQWALKHGKLLSLSEQELVDCDKTDNGCNGGYMTSAYEAIENLGGLETENDYPYDGADESCKFNKSEVQVSVTSSVNITTNETEIAQWLFANGPISIGINANAMQFYMGGVSHPFKFLCSKNQLDHGVLLVGFGVHRTSIRHKLLPYWLIKNSWGPHWGEKGYYRVYRGDGTCGVNQMASSAIVA